ncbi:unnamed protein product [Oikopleura dioica]|uniref:Sulfotransferase n=1 Tax=Oikopleura dioica TaxID=34765 RepID=E4X234_OIKDI|nr:unnamed protein product [Oikopleura dioica]
MNANLNFCQIITFYLIIICVVLFKSGETERAEIAERFYTVDDVKKIIEEKIQEINESFSEEKYKNEEKIDNFEELKKDENETRPRRKVILIVTFMRSGSTFLGEMFNNHEDAFYIFVPLHPLSQFGFSKTYLNERLKILKNNLNCDFEEQYDITIPWKSFKNDEMDLAETLDKRGDFIFRSKHRRLCAPPFCARDFSNDLYSCNDECGLVDLSLAKRVCQPLISVAKTIRFVEIELLQQMAEENNLDLKLMFLARDPRGILESRVKIYQKNETAPFFANEKNIKAVDEVCKKTRGILENIENSEWLKNRTLIIRYEDLAMEPQTKSAEILKFAELEVNSKIVNWIDENTSAKNNLSGTYDTSRDSRKTALAFRSILDYSE